MGTSPHDPPPRNLASFSSLKNIVARLRSPQGCPWDRQQTHSSLRASLLQECYEVLEALDEENPQKLCQELGDLMMNILLHAQIAAEVGEFDISDVFRAINTKLIHRHPHVFGSRKVNGVREVLQNWEELKQEEPEAASSLLDGVPRQMPALASSQELQRRAASVGFDWEEVEGIIEKIAEESAELEEAISPREREREFGDLIFVLANLARRWNIDSEAALRQANERFRRRFSYMEEMCRNRGVNLDSLSLEELDALWEEAKEHTDAFD
jgi:tetrapyrrole methylase family protein/MazG family protein